MSFSPKIITLCLILSCLNSIHASTAVQKLNEYNNEMHQLRSGQQRLGAIDDISDKAIKLFTGARINPGSTQRADSKSRKAIRTAIIHRIMGQPNVNTFDLEESAHISHDAAVAFIHKVVILLRQDDASFLFNIDDVVIKIRENKDDLFKCLNVTRNAHWLAVDQRLKNCSDDNIKKTLGKHFIAQYLDACRYYPDVKRQDIIVARDIDDGVIGAGTQKLWLDTNDKVNATTPVVYHNDTKSNNVVAIRFICSASDTFNDLQSAVKYKNRVYVNYEEYHKKYVWDDEFGTIKNSAKSIIYNINQVRFNLNPKQYSLTDINMIANAESRDEAIKKFLQEVDNILDQDEHSEDIKNHIRDRIKVFFNLSDPRENTNMSSIYYKQFYNAKLLQLKISARSVIYNIDDTVLQQESDKRLTYFRINMIHDNEQKQKVINDYLKRCLVEIRERFNENLTITQTSTIENFYICSVYDIIAKRFNLPILFISADKIPAYNDFKEQNNGCIQELMNLVLQRLPLINKESSSLSTDQTSDLQKKAHIYINQHIFDYTIASYNDTVYYLQTNNFTQEQIDYLICAVYEAVVDKLPKNIEYNSIQN